MKKLILLIIIHCYFNISYTKSKDNLPIFYASQSQKIGFTKGKIAADLQLKLLTALATKDSIQFILTYSSKKDRFLSFFNPPFGTILMYFDRDGLKKKDTVTTFYISKNTLQYIDHITMRFSENENSGSDRNFISLSTSDTIVKNFLGLDKKKPEFHFLSKIFPLPLSYFVIVALCVLIPLLLFLGNKTLPLINSQFNRIRNNWLVLNLKVFIYSSVFIISILIFTGNFKSHILLTIYFYLLLICLISANFVFILEKFLFKRKKLFWLKEYFTLVALITSLYVTYKFFNILSDEIISHRFISTEYIIFCGMLIGFTRLINNYITHQKITSLKEKELEIVKLNEQKTRSDLSALQSRINPHFLYNALNSIAELCWKNPEKAERMALNLSRLFRYTINRENTDFNLLKNEIEIVNLYLTIEKERFEDNLNFQIVYDKDLENISIPKFILQPLIENAIKHGIAKTTTNGFIKLTIKRVKNNLEIKVFDNGPDFPVNLNSGYGLQSIHDKLDILYPKKYSIELQNGIEKNITIVLKNGF
jgi:sensor histidine kinase YesM